MNRQFVFLLAHAKVENSGNRVLLYDPVIHNGLVLVELENSEIKWVIPSEMKVLLDRNMKTEASQRQPSQEFPHVS